MLGITQGEIRQWAFGNTLEESMNNIKKIFEKINENKEELKIKIQKEFTSLRNALNIREDELLLEVDKKFKDNFIGEEFLKESEKFPHKIKLSLENGKKIDNENKNNKLNLMIYDCIRIENNINEINNIKENINKFNNFNNFNIEFDEESNKIIEILNNMGKIKEKGEIIIKNSSIINDDVNKQNIIINWIKEKVNKNAIKFELIFKMSENRSNSKDFHKYCDNKGPTLTLVKTKKNYIFGGFTPLEWKNKGGSIYDKSNKTFVFSLNLIKKYNMINLKKMALQFEPNYGPVFGAWDFGLKEDMKKGQTYANNNCNFLSNNNLVLTGEKNADQENFEAEELELYEVIF